MKTSELKLFDRNPRTISREAMEKLKASIERDPEFMTLRPIVVDESMTVLGGNQRLRAIRELGMDEIPDSWVARSEDLTDEQKRRFVVLDNLAAGEWDVDLLANEYDVSELDDLGFDVELLGLDDLEVDAGLTDPDEVPEPPEEPVTQYGDLWVLGDHRILCGDSTVAEDVERVLGGEKADLCFTSPPYAMQRKDDYGGIPSRDYPVWFQKIASNVWNNLSDTGSFFVNIKEHVEDGQRSLYVFKTVMKMVENGWRYVDQLSGQNQDSRVAGKIG